MSPSVPLSKTDLKKKVTLLESKIKRLQKQHEKLQQSFDEISNKNEEFKRLLKANKLSLVPAVHLNLRDLSNREHSPSASETGNDRRSRTRRSERRIIGTGIPKIVSVESLQHDYDDGDNVKVEPEDAISDVEMEAEDNDNYVPSDLDDVPSRPPSLYFEIDDSDSSEPNVPTGPKKRKTNQKFKTKRRKQQTDKLAVTTVEPKTEIERIIADFLNDIIHSKSKPNRIITPADTPMEELDPFNVVLKDSVEDIVKQVKVELGKERRTNRLLRKSIPYFSEAPDVPVKIINTPNDTVDEEEVLERISQHSQEAALAVHVLKGLSRDETICILCGASFTKPQALRRHLRETHSWKPFKCRLCDKVCKRKDDLNRHIRAVHQKQYRYECRMCPKKFADASGFRRHERIHLGVKPHLCSQCGRGFPELRNLRLHMNSQHGEKEVPHRVKFVV